MVRKRPKQFNETEREQILEAIGDLRQKVTIKWMTKVKPSADDYHDLVELMNDIDRLAEKWTGDSRYYAADPGAAKPVPPYPIKRD